MNPIWSDFLLAASTFGVGYLALFYLLYEYLLPRDPELCRAPHDVLVACENLRSYPTKIDW